MYWEPPQRDHWNGIILGYYVGYKEEESTQNLNYKKVEVGSQYGGEVLLQDLKKFTEYSIVVQAYNSQGAGTYSDPVLGKTAQDGK